MTSKSLLMTWSPMMSPPANKLRPTLAAKSQPLMSLLKRTKNTPRANDDLFYRCLLIVEQHDYLHLVTEREDSRICNLKYLEYTGSTKGILLHAEGRWLSDFLTKSKSKHCQLFVLWWYTHINWINSDMELDYTHLYLCWYHCCYHSIAF